MSVVTEIAADVYRISTFVPGFGIQFNQFLIKDEEPFLMHTAFRTLFDVTREAVAKVIDPATLRWIGYSHFEPDECGALNSYLAIAPRAEPLASFVGSNVMLRDFSDRPAKVVADGDVIETGKHRVRFVSTPHVPHCWDAGLFFDETSGTLLCSDLFFHPGDPEALTETSVVEPARAAMTASLSGPMANDVPYTPHTDSTLQRLADLKPRTLALMHGSAFHGDGEQALRDLAGVWKELLAGRTRL
ncbi:MAG TPA: MBL fold metallo-hydrolase [Candidatus Binatia bacterium]|nr:MBL fold metallo-hydrolase [Candidatus Binatia bacterium]